MTDFLIITSKEDKASMNMRELLLEDRLLTFKELDNTWHDNPLLKLEMVLAKMDWGPFFARNNIYLGLTDSPLIYLDDLKLTDAGINPDRCIFASRHRSEAERPAFLTHSTGNWSDDADYGGKPRKLSKTSAILLKAAYQTLLYQKSVKKSNYAVDIEVTHHGPTDLEKPLIFMELGSSEKEWTIKEAGLVVAHSLFLTCLDYSEKLEKNPSLIGLGFGGTHYAPQFSKLMDTRNVAMSFICPKYFIQILDKEFIEQMVENTIEKVDAFIIDWKGTNSDDKKHLIPLLEEFEIPIKKTKDF